jgi:hypothetical protein
MYIFPECLFNLQKINFKTLPGRIYGYRKILSEPIVKVIGKDRQKK